MLLYYIDNEVAAFGEWDSVVEAGSSTIVQSGDAAFPERGAVGLRADIVNGANAYVRKDFAAQSTLYAGLWLYLHSGYSVGSGSGKPIVLCGDSGAASGTWLLYLQWYDSKWWICVYDYAVGAYPLVHMPIDRWTYLVGGVHRAAGTGWLALWMDGALMGQNTGRNNAGTIDNLRVGNSYGNADVYALTLDIDEIKIATSLTGTERYRPWRQGAAVAAAQPPAILPTMIGAWRRCRR